MIPKTMLSIQLISKPIPPILNGNIIPQFLPDFHPWRKNNP